MANLGDISKINLPNGNVVNIKDATARAQANWNTNNGVKNLLKLSEPITYTKGNVVLNIKNDGTCTVSLSSGTTASATLSYVIADITALRSSLDYTTILSGCPSGGSYSNGYALYIANSGTTAEKDEGSGVTIQPNQSLSKSVLAVIVRSGTTINSTLTFMPMIRPAHITDSTYEPYALPNTKITPELIELVDSGAKNLYNPSNTSTSASGLTGTITRNSDGSYTINGTTSGTVYYSMGTWITPEDGYYILSGGSAAETAYQLIYDDHNWQTYESGEKKKLAYWSKGSTHNLYIRLGSGITLSNVTFYPMICTKAAWDVSQKYVPYAPTNAELYEMIKALQS